MKYTNSAMDNIWFEPPENSSSEPDWEDPEDEFKFDLETFKNRIYDYSERNDKWT
jgi:hypothetical protein